ncbi:MAG: right-handed parallel beta-helix repeat-containing protein [Chloroflexi bacterium]|nr:right-handed parallel beta-helix repeat-containing protein [Chloroflexota bacterium]
MKKKLIPYIVSLVFAMMVSLLMPLRVTADETPPPPTEEPALPPTEVPSPIHGAPLPIDVSPTEEAVHAATEESPAPVQRDTLPVATEAPIDSINAEGLDQEFPSATDPLLGSLPEDTSIVVQVGGEIEPLATQAAQTAIETADPIWCPAGAPPIPNVGGCTSSYATLEGLINDILDGTISAPSADGTIWITNTPDASVSPIEIDGSDPMLAAWSNYALTIQGGWTGTPAGAISGSSVFSVPLAILNWNGDVTVNNLTFDNVGFTGLTVETIDADIVVSNVTSANNSSAGSGGIDLSVNQTLSTTGGTVTVSNVTVNNNNGTGLSIAGLVTFVDLYNVIAVSNGFEGISIGSDGSIVAENITASNNGLTGADFSTDASFTLQGANLFENNGGTGLYILANGDVTLENIVANTNGTSSIFGAGAEIYSTTGGVTMSGANIFENNLNNGVLIEAGMDVSLSNITASQNGGMGLEIIASNGNVSVLGANTFENNDSLGLYVEADGAIETQNLSTNGNSVALYSGGSIVMNGVNVFVGNSIGSAGLHAEADGDINAENLTVSGSTEAGAELIAQGHVNLSGINVFQMNSGSGLYAQSGAAGHVSVQNISAVDNGAMGIELYSGTGGTFILGTNLFANNQSIGLYVESGGDISAENIEASGNASDGASLTAVGDVTLSGTNIFQSNTLTGLYIEAAGNIQVENVSANGNRIGALFDSTNGGVSVLGTNQFNNNSTRGVSIFSIDNIYVENAIVQGNNGVGMLLDTFGSAQVVCSVVTGNTDFEITAYTVGFLTLAGTDFGGDVNNNLNVDEDFLILVSNGCFTYPVTEPGQNDETPASDAPEGNYQPLPINYLPISSGETTGLDCGPFSGAILSLPDGDGVFLPCGFGEEARLIDLNQSMLPGDLPRNNFMIAGMNVLVISQDQPVQPIGDTGSIWYWYVGEDDEGNQQTLILFWDGEKWVETSATNLPFIRVFFVVPENMKSANLAILFWDGLNWVELTDGANLGDGRFVQEGGRFDGRYFETEVNFTGTFVLVQKSK